MKPGLALAAAQASQAAAGESDVAASPSLSQVPSSASSASLSSSPSPNPLTRLLHLASTTLPVGAFSYSQGLEWAVEAGTVRDEAGALRWIGDQLEWNLGRWGAPPA